MTSNFKPKPRHSITPAKYRVTPKGKKPKTSVNATVKELFKQLTIDKMADQTQLKEVQSMGENSDVASQDANTRESQHKQEMHKDSGYRLRHHSYQFAVKANSIATPKEGSADRSSQVIEEEEDDLNTSSQSLDIDDMGSTDSLGRLKPLLRKEDYEKKSTAHKLDGVFEAVNKLYSFHAQMSAKIKPIEVAVFDKNVGILPHLEDVATHAKGTDERLEKLQEEIVLLKEELNITKGIVHKQSKQIETLQGKQADLVARSMAKNLTISGIKGDEQKADTKIILEAFLDEQMGIEVEEHEQIQVAHRIGIPMKGHHRPIVFKCPPSLRKKIFNNVQKLAGKPYSINQQYPEAIAEKKKEIRHMIKTQNKAEEHLADGEKSTILVRNNNLYINGQLKRKKLLPPTPLNLFVDMAEKEKMANLKLRYTPPKSAKHSEFVAAACVAPTMNDVHLAYKRLFREYPNADHIAAAFATEGNQGHQDNGEYGAGFRILSGIQEAHLDEVAVFVVRTYGGEHLGPQRFTIIKDLAIDALALLS